LEKARQNRRKHAVSFEQAATVFLDPNALTLYDEEHSEEEDRWITLGISASGGLVTVCHTFEEFETSHVHVRIFSSRKATRAEISKYTG